MTARRTAPTRRARTAPTRRALCLLAVPFVLAGCGAGGGSTLVAEAPARFAGMDREALNACAGPPTAVEEDPRGTALIYQMSQVRTVDIPRPDAGPGRVGTASTALPPPPSVTYRRNCAARFVLSDGRIVAAEFQGMGAGGDAAPEACEPFVKRCLRRR